jgi:seryl-tRNA synthetase
MLDINLFRVDKGGDPELVRESQRRRHDPVEWVDQVIEMDKKWRDGELPRRENATRRHRSREAGCTARRGCAMRRERNDPNAPRASAAPPAVVYYLLQQSCPNSID